MKKLFLLLPLLSSCKTPDIDKAISSLPGYEFGEVQYYSRSNFHKTDILAQGGKIEEDALTVDSLTISHHNNMFEIGASVKDLRRPLRTFSASPTGI